jgi:conjugative transfer signal peptidase TraF
VNRAIREIGAALRAAKLRRQRVAKRVVLTGLGIAALMVTIASPPVPRLVWNVSSSAPVGLYSVMPGATVMPGTMVLGWPPQAVRQLAARRGYLPANVPLLKRVAAGPGDTICAVGRGIMVNGVRVATRHDNDKHGRPLPRWTGCRTLRLDEFLLLMTGHPDSFDGRYFGVSKARDVIGTARLVWRR